MGGENDGAFINMTLDEFEIKTYQAPVYPQGYNPFVSFKLFLSSVVWILRDEGGGNR